MFPKIESHFLLLNQSIWGCSWAHELDQEGVENIENIVLSYERTLI